jgi:hypothetical protein
LYNILIAIYNLSRSGSKAEVVIMIQMAAGPERHELPSSDTAMFSELANNTVEHFKYVLRPMLDSFY